MEKMIIALYSPTIFNSLLEMVHNLISLNLFLSFCQNKIFQNFSTNVGNLKYIIPPLIREVYQNRIFFTICTKDSWHSNCNGRRWEYYFLFDFFVNQIVVQTYLYKT